MEAATEGLQNIPKTDQGSYPFSPSWTLVFGISSLNAIFQSQSFILAFKTKSISKSKISPMENYFLDGKYHIVTYSKPCQDFL